MRAPEFWEQPDHTARLAVRALAPIGWLYGATVAWKANHASPYRPRAKVVCVGNLTVGGTGKTPVAIAVARALAQRGLRPVFLTRGYSGKIRGPSFVDLADHSAAETGDEPLLLAAAAPVIVAGNRAAGARLADENGYDVIVMDDGHQNFALAKDLSIVVVDAQQGFGNGHVLPAGPLREPVMQGLARADAIALVGAGSPDLGGFRGPALRVRLCPTIQSRLENRRVIAFAGIGRPEKFFDTLRAKGAQIVETRSYADHHAYTASEIARLKAKAREHDAMLITTEKDFVRLAPIHREGVAIVPVEASFDDPTALARLLESVARGSNRKAP
jgi:tetraacyldisaccharide 4'-kinase